MNALSTVRASAPAAPPAAMGGEMAGAPGFAALLEAAREPTPPVACEMPAESDAPEAATPESPDTRDLPETRAAKPHRKLASPKAPSQPVRSEPPAALDVSALLQAKTVAAAAADVAPPAATDKTPAWPAADAALSPTPNPQPALPAVMTDTAVDAALATRAAAVPPSASRPATVAEPLAPNAADMPAGAAAQRTIEPRGVPAAEAPPDHPEKAAAPRANAAPNPTDTTPAPITLAPAPASATTAAPASSAAAPFSAHLAAALESPAFAPALATQVRWLVEGGVQHAQLTLNPAEMGPVAVRIAVEGSQARIDFMADLAPTRAALEASLPTLAAALADGGLTLAGGGVFDGSSARQSASDGQGQPRSRSASAHATFADTGPHVANPAPSARGLVDLVA